MDINRVRKQLEIDEGVKYEIYEDHLGYKTFGIGHLVLDTDPEVDMPIGTVVTHQRVEDAFETDFNISVAECSVLYQEKWNTFPEEVQEILVNMMFNLGRPRLGKFKNMRKALEEQKWKLAADEGRDSLWYRQVGGRAARLMSRLENVESNR
jgi:lysozyme